MIERELKEEPILFNGVQETLGTLIHINGKGFRTRMEYCDRRSIFALLSVDASYRGELLYRHTHYREGRRELLHGLQMRKVCHQMEFFAEVLEETR